MILCPTQAFENIQIELNRSRFGFRRNSQAMNRRLESQLQPTSLEKLPHRICHQVFQTDLQDFPVKLHQQFRLEILFLQIRFHPKTDRHDSLSREIVQRTHLVRKSRHEKMNQLSHRRKLQLKIFHPQINNHRLVGPHMRLQP